MRVVFPLFVLLLVLLLSVCSEGHDVLEHAV